MSVGKETRTIRRDAVKEIEMLVSSGSPTNESGEPIDLRSMVIQDKNKRRGSSVTKDQLEALFRLDGLTFRIVQKYIEKCLGSGYILKGGTKGARELCQKFCDDIDMKFFLSQVVQDIFITGNGMSWVELGYTTSGRNIRGLRLLNPKSGIDFLKDSEENIVYDSDLNAKGYKLGGEFGYPLMEWDEHRIEKGGEVVWTNPGGQDGRDRIAYFQLIGVGSPEHAISPLEPVYKAAIIRLNLEDTIGNSAFRASGLLARVGYENQDPREVSDEWLDHVKNELLSADQDTVWSIRRNVELGTFPIPDTGPFSTLMYYFADMQSSGAGIGIALILQPMDRGYRGDIAVAQEEFMDSVRLFQERLQWQVREYIFKRLLKARGLRVENAPYIKLRGRESGIALSQARRISTYARYELLTPDPRLEAWIRETEGLPMKDDQADPDAE